MKHKLLLWTHAFQKMPWNYDSRLPHRAAIVVLVQLLLCAFNQTLSWSQTRWIKSNNNPVLNGGPANAWDGGRVFYHYVLFDGSKYHMWYVGYNPTLNVPPAIGYATSPDGLQWTKYANNPVMRPISGSWEAEGLFTPVVIFDGVSFRMWYSANDASYVSATGYATSPDGINWTKLSANPILRLGASGTWDDAEASVASIIFDGTSYKMWYLGQSGDYVYRIGYATSSDGMNWTKYTNNPVLNAGPPGAWDEAFVYMPDVHFDGTTYQMWYNGFSPTAARIGRATSSDGVRWTKDPANPVLDVGSPGTWESKEVGHPRVLFDGNKLKMWYIGVDQQINVRIGYASSEVSTTVSNQKNESLLTQYALFENYPNPFNPATTIAYHLPRASQVKLLVYNLAGQHVRTLVDAPQAAGRFQINWDGKDDIGNGLASGVYLYRLEAGNFAETKKMILMR